MFASDEDAAEAVRKWWIENGKSVIAGAVLGIGAVFGWEAWQGYTKQQAETASLRFDQVSVALESDPARAAAEGEALMKDSSSSPYAAMAALALAKERAEAGDLKSAEERLRWAIEHSRQPELKEVARLRLARILAASKRGDEALAELGQLTSAFDAVAAEIRGDIYRERGELNEAKAAYQAALAGDGGNRAVVQMKLDELGG